MKLECLAIKMSYLISIYLELKKQKLNKTKQKDVHYQNKLNPYFW